MNRRSSPPATKTRPNSGKRAGGGLSLKVLFALALLLVIPRLRSAGVTGGWIGVLWPELKWPFHF